MRCELIANFAAMITIEQIKALVERKDTLRRHL